MCLLGSTQFDRRIVANWGEIPNNPLQFEYFTPDQIESYLRQAGFASVEFFRESCAAYDNAPEFRVHKIFAFQVRAMKGSN
ncbi:hypothetical protein Enr8_06180 [Blastopirellula retiformator]|uniref:Uncharacterized protein n=2 Tax=Blastopirellula retiformator TaxID=2527970 RepID=A0A5C5VJY9_9BACT|nr:hypothetical protein Enr8_06180 [Blastopirellula retiformator]